MYLFFQAEVAASRPFWTLTRASSEVAGMGRAVPVTQAAKCLGWSMSPLRPIGGWREEWALAALELMSHDPGAVNGPLLTLAQRAHGCSSPRVRRAAATFLAVRDPASAVAAHVAVARDAREADDERLHALDVRADVQG